MFAGVGVEELELFEELDVVVVLGLLDEVAAPAIAEPPAASATRAVMPSSTLLKLLNIEFVLSPTGAVPGCYQTADRDKERADQSLRKS
jgi:hypothetical protein